MFRRAGLRVRAKRDYWVFVARHEWPIILAVFGLVLGVVTLLPSEAAIALSIIALLLGLVSFVSDYRKARIRWSAYEFLPAVTKFSVAEWPEPIDYRAARYETFPDRGSAIVDAEIDRYLRAQPIPLSLGDDPYRLPEFLRDTAPQVLRTTVQGSVVFNGPVLGLVDDPLPSVTGGVRPVRAHRARFFDGQCSNELCALLIRHRGTGEVYDLREQVLVDTAGRLASLAETDLANIVGISTIALTTDDFVVIIEQTANNSASGSLLAPSGSGSLEPRDAESGGTSLQDVLVAGMERELAEECGLHPDDVVETQVVGYARWLERGAKPEFFGVTRLTISSAELALRKTRGSEKLYSGGSECVEVDLPALARELASGARIVDAPSCPPLFARRGSIPLLLALRAAALASAER